MKDVGYQTIDLDQQLTADEILLSALNRLRNSAATAGIYCSDFDKLFNKNNMKIIKKGFMNQIQKINNIDHEKISGLIGKHVPGNEDKIIYIKYLSDKAIKAQEMTLSHVKELLKNYISRVELYDLNSGFIFDRIEQARNRAINCNLAKVYLNALEEGKPCNFDMKSILKERENIRILFDGKRSNVIRSRELKEIFSLAANLKITTELLKPVSPEHTTELEKDDGSLLDKSEAINAIKETLATLPNDFENLPHGLDTIDPEEFHDVFDEIVVDNPSPTEVKSGEPVVKNLLEELDKLKTKLGGSPNFKNGTPTLMDKDANRTFLGIPMPAVKDWFRMVLVNEWHPNFFWSAVAKTFGVTKEGMTKYEDFHQRIQRFGLLVANKERFKEILMSKDENRYNELAKITGLTWHPKLNDPSVEKVYLELIEIFLTDYFVDAKERREEALIKYFQALAGVCYEDRARNIEEYIKKYPLKKVAVEEYVTNVADYNSNNTLSEVYQKEIGELYAKNRTYPTPQQAWEHLVKKGVLEMTFFVDNSKSERAPPSLEGFNELVEYFQDDLCILDDGPLAVAKQDFIRKSETYKEDLGTIIADIKVVKESSLTTEEEYNDPNDLDHQNFKI